MKKFRHIYTAELPEGFDIADLIEQLEAKGVTDEEMPEHLRIWCLKRIRDGLPKTNSKAKPPPAKKKATKKKPPVTVQSDNVVALKKPEPKQDYGIPMEFTEDAIAEAFTAEHEHSLIHVGALNEWRIWDGTKWDSDQTLLVLDLARKQCKKSAKDVLARTEMGAKRDRIAQNILTRKYMGNIESIARTDQRHAALPSQFDADPWILNTPDGIIDLRTGLDRPARKKDYASKITPVGPGEASQLWLDFLDTSTRSDTELIAYLQRMAGYCLTGSIAEHAFFFIFGEGGSGKGTFANTLQWLLGTYSAVAQLETFTAQRFSRHMAEVAMLQGARIVTSQETEEGKRWAESRIKSLTGGDPITAEYKHKNPFTFQPSFKLLFTGNHKPPLRNVDEAMKRRLHMIPFDHKLKKREQDGELGEKLRSEEHGPGILAWAIEGCLEWQKTLLDPPERVLASTADYFEQEDILGTFLTECCDLDAGYLVITAGLYNCYKRWAHESGEYELSLKRFKALLETRQYLSENIHGTMMVAGIRLKADPDARRDWMDND